MIEDPDDHSNFKIFISMLKPSSIWLLSLVDILSVASLSVASLSVAWFLQMVTLVERSHLGLCISPLVEKVDSSAGSQLFLSRCAGSAHSDHMT